MNISLNWLKDFVDFDYTPGELDRILTMLGIEVEHVFDYAKKYDNFIIAKVITKEKHFNADKLSVCTVDDGTTVRTIVCGAPNVEAGQTVVLGLPGAIVPKGAFKLELRSVRGVTSEGMICSRSELELDDDHSGIWVLPDNAIVGTKLADFMNVNDTIFEIGVTPNRADCLSHFGIAREISAYSGNKFKMPELNLIESENDIYSEFKVKIEDYEKCPRYACRIVKNVKVTESPEWLKDKIILLGMRPVNVIVDITNLVLLECGQPLHAFDLDTLRGKKIIVKTATEGEKFTTLDSKERTLDNSMLMICDSEGPIAVGGVMGGENSEIKDATVDILIESAYFNPSSIRKTAKKLGISSEASYRFERGVDPENIIFALNLATQLIAELSGGAILNGTIDVYPRKIQEIQVKMRYKQCKKIIGAEIPSSDMIHYLERLYFRMIEINNDFVIVAVPSYRVDINSEIDLIEEIARFYNYDNIEPQYVSAVNFSFSNVNTELAIPPMREKIRNFLVQNGFTEIVTQNIIDPASALLSSEEPIIIANPLGEELSVMRPSLVTSMLKTIERNIRLGNHDLKMFEIGKVFSKTNENVKSLLPGILENEELIIGISGYNTPLQWGTNTRDNDFYDIKGIFSNLIAFLNIDGLKLSIVKDENLMYSKNSLAITYKKKELGRLGEISKNICKKYDLELPVFSITLDLKKLYSIDIKPGIYNKVAPFPGIKRDLAFIMDDSINSDTVLAEINSNAGLLIQSVTIFDVYKGKNLGEGKKSIAFSLSFASPERTLTDQEIDGFIDQVIKAVEHKFNASIRK